MVPSDDQVACECDRGKYDTWKLPTLQCFDFDYTREVLTNKKRRCTPCPMCANCALLSKTGLPVLREGYQLFPEEFSQDPGENTTYRSYNSSPPQPMYYAFQCTPKSACSEQNLTVPEIASCEEGHTGLLCALCEPGWKRNETGSCSDCKGQKSYTSALNVSFLLFFALVIMYWVTTYIRSRRLKQKDKEKWKSSKPFKLAVDERFQGAFKNGDLVKVKEFIKILSKEDGILQTIHLPSQGVCNLRRRLCPIDEAKRKEIAKKICDSIDVDGDGQIHRAELKAWLHSKVTQKSALLPALLRISISFIQVLSTLPTSQRQKADFPSWWDVLEDIPYQDFHIKKLLPCMTLTYYLQLAIEAIGFPVFLFLIVELSWRLVSKKTRKPQEETRKKQPPMPDKEETTAHADKRGDRWWWCRWWKKQPPMPDKEETTADADKRGDHYFVVFLAYPTVTSALLNHLFGCRQLTKKLYVQLRDYEVECWPGLYDEKYLVDLDMADTIWWITWVGCGIYFVYCLAIPVRAARQLTREWQETETKAENQEGQK
eukprot:COSAG01_NODE_9768_length_2349_cov_2.387556_2_plen_542_part_01